MKCAKISKSCQSFVAERRENPQHSRWKRPKCNLARISDMNRIPPITCKQTRCSGKLYGVFVENGLILLDPSKTKMVSYSEMRRTSLVHGERTSNIFQTQSLSHHRTHMTYIWGRKYHHCSRSLFPYQSTEGWEGCKLLWNPTWNVQSLESRSSLTDSCVSCDLVFWKEPKHWQTGVIIPILKNGDRRESTNYQGISLLSLPGKVYFMLPSALKKQAAK